LRALSKIFALLSFQLGKPSLQCLMVKSTKKTLQHGNFFTEKACTQGLYGCTD